MINIADKLLVGLSGGTASRQDLPSSEITPIGNSSNEKRKIDKINHRYKNSIELDNVPLPGFTLTTSEKPSWNSTNTYWGIIDPRGFTSSISSSNLEHILHYTGITEGLIQEKCVWARENTQTTMILVPVNSDEYREAKNNTELLLNKVEKANVNLGDMVLLENGLEGVYLGSMVLYGTNKSISTKLSVTTEVIGKRQILQVNNQFFYRSDLKILKVIDPIETPLTKQEALDVVRKGKELNYHFTSADYAINAPASTYLAYTNIRYITNKLVKDAEITYSFEEIDLTKATELFHKGYDEFDSTMLLLEDNNKHTYLINHPRTLYTKMNVKPLVTLFDIIKVQINPTTSCMNVIIPTNYRGNSYYYSPAVKSGIGLSSYSKFYQITKHISNEKYI